MVFINTKAPGSMSKCYGQLAPLVFQILIYNSGIRSHLLYINNGINVLHVTFLVVHTTDTEVGLKLRYYCKSEIVMRFNLCIGLHSVHSITEDGTISGILL